MADHFAGVPYALQGYAGRPVAGKDTWIRANLILAMRELITRLAGRQPARDRRETLQQLRLHVDALERHWTAREGGE